MVAAAGELHSNLIDDWLMSDALRAIYPESGMIGIPAENLPDLLVCMLTPQPAAAEADEAAEASLLAPVKALSTLNQLHLGRMLQFDERHGKRWFREHRFSVLVAWLTLQELLKERYGVASDDEVEVEQLEGVVARWVEASGRLDMEAFLSGYEIGELMRLKV